MRVVNTAKKRVLHRFKHWQKLGFLVVFPVDRVEELMQSLHVHVAHILQSTHNLRQVRVLTEEVRLAKILLEEGVFVKDLSCRIVEVNVIQKSVDAFGQDRQSIERVILDHDGVCLPQIARPSMNTTFFSIETAHWRASTVDSIVCIKKLANSLLVVTLRVEEDKYVA